MHMVVLNQRAVADLVIYHSSTPMARTTGERRSLSERGGLCPFTPIVSLPTPAVTIILSPAVSIPPLAPQMGLSCEGPPCPGWHYFLPQREGQGTNLSEDIRSALQHAVICSHPHLAANLLGGKIVPDCASAVPGGTRSAGAVPGVQVIKMS